MYSPASVCRQILYTCIFVGMYVCEQRPGASSSSACHQILPVIPLATGDEVITFLKVKVRGGGMRSTERPSSFFNLIMYTEQCVCLCVQFECVSDVVVACEKALKIVSDSFMQTYVVVPLL